MGGISSRKKAPPQKSATSHNLWQARKLTLTQPSFLSFRNTTTPLSPSCPKDTQHTYIDYKLGKWPLLHDRWPQHLSQIHTHTSNHSATHHEANKQWPQQQWQATRGRHTCTRRIHNWLINHCQPSFLPHHYPYTTTIPLPRHHPPCPAIHSYARTWTQP